MLKKIKNIFSKKEFDIQKLVDISNELYFGEEGAKLLNQGKKKRSGEPKKLNEKEINKLNRKRFWIKIWNGFISKYLTYVLWAIGVIFFIFIIPITYNKIFNTPVNKFEVFAHNLAGETSDWISFYGSYFGGLFGGLLTLIGVRLTIKHNNKQQFIKDFPKKDVALRDIITEIEGLKDNIESYHDIEDLLACFEEFKSKEFELREKAVIVSPSTYKVLNKFFEFVGDRNRIRLVHTMSAFHSKESVESLQNILINYVAVFSRLKRKLFDEYEKSAL